MYKKMKKRTWKWKNHLLESEKSAKITFWHFFYHFRENDKITFSLSLSLAEGEHSSRMICLLLYVRNQYNLTAITISINFPKKNKVTIKITISICKCNYFFNYNYNLIEQLWPTIEDKGSKKFVYTYKSVQLNKNRI